MKPDIAAGAPTGGQRATAREFVAVVFRRRWLILGMFLITTATVLTVAFTTPVAYVSSGRVLVRRGELMSALVPERHLMNDWETDLGSEVQTVKSYPVLQLARELLNEHPQADGRRLGVNAGQVDAEVMGKSNVVGIAYQDRDPEVAQKVCDAVMRAYIEYRQGSELRYPEKFFDTEITKAAAELERWTELRREFANQASVVDLVEQRRNLISVQSTLELRRTEVAADLAEAQAQQRMMRQLEQDPEIDLPTLGQAYSNESALVEIKRRIVEKQGRLAELRERYREEAPEIQNAMTTLQTLRDMLKREVASRLQMSQSRIEALQSRRQVVDHDIAVAQAALDAMPDKEARLGEIDRQIGTWKTRYDGLVEKSNQARINKSTDNSIIIYMLNPAGQPVARNTRDYVRLALAPAFSLVVGIGLAFFIDGLDLTVHTAGQAEEEIDLPVLAAITERRRSG
ncbi:MAG: hypothetical protein HZC42_02605 [Candidatus Eisenbacteria bacterium]|nr:hypothetical protein [Candidatus Eisenbacteria bacterium]